MHVAVPTLKERNHDGKTGMTEKRDGRLRRTGTVRRRRTKKKKGMTLYKGIVLLILLVGGVFLCLRMYQMWQIHEDMKRTLQQEQALTEENQRLKDRKEQLISPDAVEKQAREQFGLAEPGEIPYRR